MPIGLFENELTVQLWQPVTIRGYTFNVGDNVTLDQTKVEKTPAVGGDFAWLFATYQAERTGNAVRLVLEPAAAAPVPRGEQGPDALADLVPARSVPDPAGGPVADAAVPLRQGRQDSLARRPTSWPTTSPRATGPSSPTSRSPSRTRATSPSANKAHPDYLGAGWPMMTNKASPCLQCHAIGQFKPTGGAAVVNGPDLRQVASAVPARLSRRVARQPAPAGSLHGDAPEHRTARGRPDPGAQDVREQADRDGPGDPRHAAELRERRRAPARQQLAEPRPTASARAADAAPRPSGECSLIRRTIENSRASAHLLAIERRRHVHLRWIRKPGLVGLDLGGLMLAAAVAGCGGQPTDSSDASVVLPDA